MINPSDGEYRDTEVTISLPSPLRDRRRTLPVVWVLCGVRALAHHNLTPGGSVLVGRAPDAGLMLPHESVSRAHVRLTLSPAEDLLVEDLGSTNGTWIAGRRLEPMVPVYVPPGTVFDVGACSMRYERMAVTRMQHLARLGEQLASAVRDDLTGLLRRGWLQEELPALAAQAQAAETPLSLVMIDIDRFKGINDTHGHAVGDAVLVEIARLLTGAVRHGEPIIRYGGDEMVVVLPSCGLGEARDVAERMRMAVVRRDWRELGVESGRVTLSLGVAQQGADETEEQWFERADGALYAAKNAGRNCIYLGVPPAGGR